MAGLSLSPQLSSICRAAVHAGVVRNHGGYVDVMPVDKRKAYTASLQNGIFSERYTYNHIFNLSCACSFTSSSFLCGFKVSDKAVFPLLIAVFGLPGMVEAAVPEVPASCRLTKIKMKIGLQVRTTLLLTDLLMRKYLSSSFGFSRLGFYM